MVERGVLAECDGGVIAASPIVAALLWREMTGEGQYIDVSVHEGLLLLSGVEIERWADMNRQGYYSGDTHVHFISAQSGLLDCNYADSFMQKLVSFLNIHSFPLLFRKLIFTARR